MVLIKSIFRGLFLLIMPFLFASDAMATNIDIRIDSPLPGRVYTSPITVSGAYFMDINSGNWGCPIGGDQATYLQYFFTDNSGNTYTGLASKFPSESWHRVGSWYPFEDAPFVRGVDPVMNLPVGNYNFSWRIISLPSLGILQGGRVCWTSIIDGGQIRIADASEVPTIDFLINGAAQDFTINNPLDNFSYSVSASLNAERCYVFYDNPQGSSWVWNLLPSCNFGNSGISINSPPSSFMNVPLVDGDNNVYVKAWNSSGGESAIIKRTINVVAGLPRVDLSYFPPLGTFGDSTNVQWNVTNADVCVPSSSPQQSWWDSVTVPLFFGWSNNAFNPVPTPPVTSTYELSLACSNSRGTSIGKVLIVPQTPGYCGDGGVNTTIGEECDLGAQNGISGSGCDNSCRVVQTLSFGLSADETQIIFPNPARIRATLIDSGLPGISDLDCDASNTPENEPNWLGSINLSQYSETERDLYLSLGTHNVFLMCDNGFESKNRELTINVVNREPGVCGADNGRVLLSVPTNLCDSGLPSPSTPSYNSSSREWNWQCLPTGGALGTQSCFANMAEPPQINNVDIDPEPVIADSSTQHSIVISATDNLGANNLSTMYSMINFGGTHSGLFRGYLGWSTRSFPFWLNSIKDNRIINCTGGGEGAVHSAYGANYINLLTCRTEIIGNTRYTTFNVTFDSSFTDPTAGNVLSGWVQNDQGVVDGWREFDEFDIANAVTVNGQCGSADGKKRFTKPSGSILCSRGNPTQVSGVGPWTWMCRGTAGGSDSRICSAQKWSIGFEER